MLKNLKYSTARRNYREILLEPGVKEGQRDSILDPQTNNFKKKISFITLKEVI